MRYQRNKGGAYAMGFGLLGLLVCVAIGIWMFSESAPQSVKSHNTGKETLEKALELGEQVSNQAYQRNRDLSGRPGANGASNGDIGVTPISPATPGIVTPSVTTPPSAVPSATKVTGNVPLQMPDHGAGALMKDME